MASNVPAVAVLSPEQARSLTDEVKHDAAALRENLLRLYDGGAHTALKYDSWKAYWEAEFDTDWNWGYKIIQAARVQRSLYSCTTAPIPEGQARQLAPLLNAEEKGVVEAGSIIDAYTEAQSDGPVTAKTLRAKVEERLPKHKTARKRNHPMGTDKNVQEVINAAKELVRLAKRVDPECFRGLSGNFLKQSVTSMTTARDQLQALIAAADQYRGSLDKPFNPEGIGNDSQTRESQDSFA